MPTKIKKNREKEKRGKKQLSTIFMATVETAKQAPYYRVLRNEDGEVIWLPCFRSSQSIGNYNILFITRSVLT